MDRWASGTCGTSGKVVYAGEREAMSCARELRLRVWGAEVMWGYRCPGETHWHLTRQAQKGAGEWAGPV